jgi:hypothetical protein
MDPALQPGSGSGGGSGSGSHTASNSYAGESSGGSGGASGGSGGGGRYHPYSHPGDRSSGMVASSSSGGGGGSMSRNNTYPNSTLPGPIPTSTAYPGNLYSNMPLPDRSEMDTWERMGMGNGIGNSNNFNEITGEDFAKVSLPGRWMTRHAHELGIGVVQPYARSSSKYPISKRPK